MLRKLVKNIRQLMKKFTKSSMWFKLTVIILLILLAIVTSNKNKPAVARTTRTKCKALYTGRSCVIMRNAAPIAARLKIKKKRPLPVPPNAANEFINNPTNQPAIAMLVTITIIFTVGVVGRNAV